MNSKTLVIHALTPLHVGVGQGLDLIDLPIAREKTTDFPVIPGSGVKGVLRARSRDLKMETEHLFGPETDGANEYASALRFTDARIVLFPVSSDLGTFAWLTCPFVLQRFARDTGLNIDTIPSVGSNIVVSVHGCVLHSNTLKAVIGGLEMSCEPIKGSKLIEKMANHLFVDDVWKNLLKGRIAIVNDDIFTRIVKTQTEVRARICINPKTGTVKKGALWYEEAVPAEAVFVSQAVGAGNAHVTAKEAMDNLENMLSNGNIQLGGNATVGMGLANAHLVGGK